MAAREDNPSDREIATIRTGFEGSSIEHVVTVDIQQELTLLGFKIEGDADEEDEASVFLSTAECEWLVESLQKALSLT